MLPQENKTKKQANPRAKNNKAFSVIEVLVATGLLSLISLAIVTLLTETMKTQRGLQAKDAQREVMAEITQHLGDGAACLNTFSGINPTTLATAPVSVSALNNAGTPVTAKYTIGAQDNSNLLEYKKFELVEYEPNATDPTQGLVNLAVTLTKLGGVTGVKDIQQKIRLKLNLDASNNITGCSAIGAASAAASAISHGKQRFLTNGTFTTPTGVTEVWVTMAAGGGGGGGGGRTNACPNGNGSSGVSSSFGGLLSTYGGGGGVAGNGNIAGGGAGGAGGAGSSLSVVGGGAGGKSDVGSATIAVRGAGGAGGGNVFGSGGLSWLFGYGGGGAGYGGGGGGGYGGGSGNTSGGGGGGAGGAIIAEKISVGPGDTVVTVGAGGAGGAGSGTCFGAMSYDGGAGAPGFVLVEW